MRSKSLFVFALLVAVAPSRAQNFNIDVGPSGAGPASSYAAAGIGGHWNRVDGAHVAPFTTGPTPQDVMLVDVNGVQTTVGMHQYGGMDMASANDPSVSGDNANLLNDYLATHSAVLESCVYLNGLQDGLYEVLTYAWMPNQPSIMQLVRFDFHPGSELVGGAWPGQHQEGVTYSRYMVTVTNGFMGLHVGVPPGGNTTIGAAFNALQVRRVEVNSVPAMSSTGFGLCAAVVAAAGCALFRRTRPWATSAAAHPR
jgi:hypothetical protein